jgi:3-oxoacyl-[acyl-carrier-protein] synthase II
MSGAAVAVTGVGVATSIAVGPDATVAALRAERPRFDELKTFDASRYDVRRGAEAVAPEIAWPGVDLGGKRTDRATRHVIGCIDAALRDAGIAAPREALDARGAIPAPPHRRELILGSTLVAMLHAERFLKDERRNGPERASYRPLGDWPAEAALQRIARRFDVQGLHTIVSNACASGAAAIALALDRLRSGRTDFVITGGFDPPCEYTHAGFGSLLLLSRHGCRPFQEGRDGMLLGEGYGILVLERADDAARRGARVRACVRGAAATSDGFHLTQPDPEGRGAARCIEAALADARTPRESIGYVNLHGTGTPMNDLSEFRALQTVFGARLPSIPTSSSKSYFGHTLGAAGAVEAIVTILALQHGFAPPTLSIAKQDPETAGLDVLSSGGRPLDARLALSNSFGFGGANAALVLAKS